MLWFCVVFRNVKRCLICRTCNFIIGKAPLFAGNKRDFSAAQISRIKLIYFQPDHNTGVCIDSRLLNFNDVPPLSARGRDDDCVTNDRQKNLFSFLLPNIFKMNLFLGFGLLFALSCTEMLSADAFSHILDGRALSLNSLAAHRSREPVGLTNSEISRYSRHLVLSDVGMKGQIALKNSSVLVIGAGGLGSPCLLYLAAAGVGHIGIVDADVVDESNLQRQIIHGTSTIGVSKCESAKMRITDINPHVKVRVYEEEFTSSSALRILEQGFNEETKYDVVVDGSDNFPTKYLINDACEIVDIPWVYSAILAFEGQMAVFNYKNGPTYRDMLPTPPPPGDVPSCAEGGVLGVLPGTMGCVSVLCILLLFHQLPYYFLDSLAPSHRSAEALPGKTTKSNHKRSDLSL